MTQEWSFRFSLFGAFGSCFVIFLSSEAAGQEHSHGHGKAPPEFSEACLPAMPNTFRPVSPDDVKRYWVSQLPTVFPPSRSSSGYAYDMPMYRARLEARTCLVQKIQGGFLDDRATMEMLRHNIRYYQNRGDRDRVEELELELLRREAISQGNLGAVVRLEELKRDEGTNLEELVRRQAQVIEELQKELAAMKRQMNQP
jgi:hypothetical protein